jgi:hypothetical protein
MLYTPYNLIGLIIFVLDLVAIFGVLGGRSSIERKALWTLIILVLPLLGMVLYYVVGRSSKDAVAG